MLTENIVAMNAMLQEDLENNRKDEEIMGKTKKERKMKVYAQSGYKHKDTPTIVLKGAWLESFGFEAGTPITVVCDEGRLVVTKGEQAAT